METQKTHPAITITAFAIGSWILAGGLAVVGSPFAGALVVALGISGPFFIFGILAASRRRSRTVVVVSVIFAVLFLVLLGLLILGGTPAAPFIYAI